MSQTEQGNLSNLFRKLGIFIAIGICLHILFVLYTTDKELLSIVKTLHFGYVILIMVLMFIPWLGYALRIWFWSKFLDENISIVECLKIVVTAEVASALSPTAVGGAPVKAALLLNKGFKAKNVGFLLTYGIIEDILFYTIGFILAATFSEALVSKVLNFLYHFVANNIVTISIIIGFIVGYVLLKKYRKLPKFLKIGNYIPKVYYMRYYKFRTRLTSSFSEIKSTFKFAIAHGKWRMVLSFSVLLLQWLAKFSVLLVLLYAFGIKFDIIQVYIRQWFIYITMLFIPTPGASGGAEASFLLIFGHSIPSKLSYIVVSMWRFFTYYYVLISALVIYLFISYKFGGESKGKVS